MKLPNWLRGSWLKPLLTIGLGMIFRNNKIPVEAAEVIVQSIPQPKPPRDLTITTVDMSPTPITLETESIHDAL